MTTLRAAVVQAPSSLLDLDGGIERARGLIRQASDQGADLVVFAEAWLGGYPAWVFGMAAWDSAEARHWYGRFVAASPVLADGGLDPVAEAAATCGVSVVMGLNERSAAGSGSVYNSLAYIDGTGRLLGVHRKLLPTHTERIIWTPASDGSGVLVHEMAGARVGGLVCWEHWQPLIRHALHEQYEDIHVAAWPDMPDSHHIATRSYAMEGRCFVLAAAQLLAAADVPAGLRDAYRAGVGPDTPEHGWWFHGGSAIAGPSGAWVVEPAFGAEVILVADLALGETIEYKHDLDVAGHYSRPDVFRLWKAADVRTPALPADRSETPS